MDKDSDPFDLERLRLPEALQVQAPVPAKTKKRREHFVMLPMTWFEKLGGAAASTHRVAWYLLYLHWKGKGEPISSPMACSRLMVSVGTRSGGL